MEVCKVLEGEHLVSVVATSKVVHNFFHALIPQVVALFDMWVELLNGLISYNLIKTKIDF
jgi:hypothetical protein